MTARREFMSYLGTGAIGGILGYYAGAKALLGIQNGRRQELGLSESTETSTETETPTETETSTESGPSDLLSLPFTETFQSGLNGWVVNHRYRTDPAQSPSNPGSGEGAYSEEYGGSVRLSVDGGPSTIGVGRQTTGISAGAELSTTVQVEGATNEPGNVSLAVFAPDGDDSPDERSANDGRVTSGEIEITHTVQQEYAEGAEIRVWADVWPGEYTAYVTEISGREEQQTGGTTVSFEHSDPGPGQLSEPWAVVSDPTAGSFNSVEISEDHATHGSQTLHMTGNGELDRILVGVDADLSDIETVRCDVYLEQANVGWGEIWFGRWLDGESDKRIGFLGQTGGDGDDRFDATGEFTDLDGDVSELSGVHELVFNMRGDNEAYFDNLRFIDASGNPVPISELNISAP